MPSGVRGERPEISVILLLDPFGAELFSDQEFGGVCRPIPGFLQAAVGFVIADS